MKAKEIHNGQWESEDGIIKPYDPSIDQLGVGAFLKAVTFSKFRDNHLYSTDLREGLYTSDVLGEVTYEGLYGQIWTEIDKDTHDTYLASDRKGYQMTTVRQFLTLKPHPMKEETIPTAGLQVECGRIHNASIRGVNGKEYPIAHVVSQDGLKRDIVEICLNLAAPDDDCMLSDFLHALQYVLNKHSTATPAPLSEQKQEGETVEGMKYYAEVQYMGELYNELEDKGTHPYDIAVEICTQWQSQHTAKQIDQYKARIEELEAALLNLWICIPDTDDALEETKGLAASIARAQSLTRHLIK